VLLDRSVFSDAVFAEVNYQQGSISQEGMKNLKTNEILHLKPDCA